MYYGATPKDPNAELDYSWDWTDWLASGETIVDSTFIVPAPLVLLAQSDDGKIATVWLGGGVEGANYRVVNRITTSAGRKDDRSRMIPMVER
jgi:hypothetical protein